MGSRQMMGSSNRGGYNPSASQPFSAAMLRDPDQVMDNHRLASRSEIFIDDDGTKIVKRCFLLAVGDDDIAGNALSLTLSYNIFDEPS